MSVEAVELLKTKARRLSCVAREAENLMSTKASDSVSIRKEPEWLQSYIDSPEKQHQLYRKTLMIVIISQIFGGAGLAAGITVGALLAQNMLGTDSFSGVPAALFTLGSAGAALFVGQLSQRFGRRSGLATGFLIGGLGAIGVVISALTNNILLLMFSLQSMERALQLICKHVMRVQIWRFPLNGQQQLVSRWFQLHLVPLPGQT
jgi:hypothetical protein